MPEAYEPDGAGLTREMIDALMAMFEGQCRCYCGRPSPGLPDQRYYCQSLATSGRRYRATGPAYYLHSRSAGSGGDAVTLLLDIAEHEGQQLVTRLPCDGVRLSPAFLR